MLQRSDGQVFDLPVRKSSNWIFTCYVLEGDNDDYLLVDPGLKSTAHGAVAQVEQLVGGSPPITGQVCTHGHSDHVGAMPALRESLGLATHLPARCADYLDGETPRALPPEAPIRFLPVWITQESARNTVTGKTLAASATLVLRTKKLCPHSNRWLGLKASCPPSKRLTPSLTP